jgi:hypothetical protein
MAMRKRIRNRRKDRRRFSKTASRTHNKNLRARTARGGFRL